MRDIYLQNTPGMFKHCQLLQLLEMEHLPDLFQHLSVKEISIELYASDWLFALFSNIIPLSQYHRFLDGFFQHGWSFFYKFALTFLGCLKEDLLTADDPSDILFIVKLKNLKLPSRPLLEVESSDSSSDYESQPSNASSSYIEESSDNIQTKVQDAFNKILNRPAANIRATDLAGNEAAWRRVFKQARREWEDKLNEEYLREMLQGFDCERLRFNKVI